MALKRHHQIKIMGILCLFFLTSSLFPVNKLTWKLLQKGNIAKATFPSELKNLAGKEVVIPGYMVLIEGESERPKEFLLVPVAGMCVHLPPPPANQMIFVRLAPGTRSGFYWGAVEITGILELTTEKSPFGKAGYTIHTAKMRNLDNF